MPTKFLGRERRMRYEEVQGLKPVLRLAGEELYGYSEPDGQ
jgi:hypothetical protein